MRASDDHALELLADFREIVDAYGSVQINKQLYLVPSPAGGNPGELMPVASAQTGEWVFLFGEWLPAYLRGEDVTVCSRNSAPDGPFFEPLN
ncbi:hypothetical protein ABZ896_49010 [Streptomyces sp. NPDC047072]|uniref:hypothetical protein n=1 Tax=Streptomyces sp. NPDC047072 TaxID=3154809 RepID=UPI0033E975AA